jgi:uncharacterized membrane protein YfcA
VIAGAIPEAWLTIGAVAFGAALAGFVEGLAGLAFPSVALALWAWALPPQIAAPLAVFGALLGEAASLGAAPGGVDFRRLAPLAAGGALGAPIGVFLLHNADVPRFRLAVGALLTLYGLYRLAARDSARAKPGGGGLDAFAGLIGGALGGFSGMAGAVGEVWTRRRGLKRDARRATAAAYAAAAHVAALAVYASAGALDAEAFRLFAVVAPTALISSYVGAGLARRSRETAIARGAPALIAAAGAALIVGVARTLSGAR